MGTSLCPKEFSPISVVTLKFGGTIRARNKNEKATEWKFDEFCIQLFK
jgi:hypothetical protein